MKTMILFVAVVGFISTVQAQQLKYPDTQNNEAKDNYHGKEIADPYRWLEEDNAEDTKAWVEAQNITENRRTRRYFQFLFP